MKLFRGVFALILTTILATTAFAQTSPELSQLVEDYMAKNGLNERNFSISYYHTGTGETYNFNETALMTAGSTFKLPLNLYYYDMERSGDLDPNGSVAGIPLSSLHRETLVNSNNDYAISMLYNLGTFYTYKQCMATYLSTPVEEIGSAYFHDNYYSAGMMMDYLTHLYNNQADYTQMIGYMKEAQQTQWFASTKGDYEIAHKYGYWDGAINDVGIVYTPDPFLLAVFTQDLSGEKILGDLCAMLTEYTVANPAPAPEPEVMPEPVAPPQPEEVPQPPIIQDVVEETLAEEDLEEVPAPEPALPTEKPTQPPMTWVEYGVIISVASLVFVMGGAGFYAYARRFGDKIEDAADETEDL